MKRLSSRRATKAKRRAKDEDREAKTTLDTLGLISAEEEAKRLEEFEAEEMLGSKYFRFSRGFHKALRWRLLPPLTKDHRWFEKDLLHFNIAKRAIRCRQLANQACYVCEEISRMRQSNDRETAAMADDFMPSASYIANGVILAVDGHKVSRKVCRVLQFSKTVYADVQGECFGTRDDFCNVADLQEGYDLSTRKVEKGQGNYTEYKTRAARQSTPLTKKESILRRIITEMADLKEEVKIPSRAKQRDIMEGLGDDEN